MESFKETLDNFCKIDGVKRVILTDLHGGILEASGETDLLDSPESLILNVLSLCSDIPGGYKMNEITQSQIEFEDLMLICVPVGSGYFLSIVAVSGVNLGRVRLEIKKNKKVIESALS
jgi:predicted regulator of Ras-like GTPase activity (Roadblock/LC7/MglB family)